MKGNNHNKRIGFIYPRFYPVNGGMSVHGYNVAKELHKRGFQVLIWGEQADGFTRGYKRTLLGLICLLISSDVVYIRIGAGKEKVFRIPVLTWLMRKKTIAELNGPTDELILKSLTKRSLQSEDRRLRRKLVFADVTVTVSPAMMKYCKEALRLKRIKLVENGGEKFKIDTGNVSPSIIKQLQEIRRKHQTVAIWSGTSEPWQGIDRIVDIAINMHPSTAIIIVSCSTDTIDQFSNIRGVYKFLSPLRSDLEYLILNSDVGLSIYNDYSWSRFGFFNSPLKFYEYLANGLHVIASPLGLMKEKAGAKVHLLENTQEICTWLKNFGNENRHSGLQQARTWADVAKEIDDIITYLYRNRKFHDGEIAVIKKSSLSKRWSLATVLSKLHFRIRLLAEYKNPLVALWLRLFSPYFPPPFFEYGQKRPSQSTKRALLLYLSQPFYLSRSALDRVHHSNLQQVGLIAAALYKLGYVVDIVDWLDEGFQLSRQYDLFFGMHKGFERISKQLGKNCLRIYYATGAYWQFENEAQMRRMAYFERRRGAKLEIPIRLTHNTWVEDSDAVIIMGNKFTAQTYAGKNSRTYKIHNTPIHIFDPNLDKKDFREARKNFLAIPSTGLLHKGLDLLLEIFAEMPDLHLWICGPLESPAEREFVDFYSKEIFETRNIHPVGWTNLHSTKFRHLAEKCAFVIFPSCSEGMAGGVLNCISCGLIPIMSTESGIDFHNGAELRTSSVEEIKKVVTEFSEKSDSALMQIAKNGSVELQENYSLAKFGITMENILAEIIAETTNSCNTVSDTHSKA